MGEYNYVDFAVLLVFLLSILGGISKGVIKEIISLATWLAAFFIACMFAAQLAAVFTGSAAVQSAVTSSSSSIGMSTAQPVSYLALGLSFVCIFIVTLLLGSLIGSIVTRAVQTTGLGIVNRLLGGVFGFARGYLIVIVLMFVVDLTPFATQPLWTTSKFVTSFAPTVQWFGNLVEPGLTMLKQNIGNTLQNVNLPSGLTNIYQGNGGH